MCSCFRIFESLELTCAVGQLVHETIQAHHKVYRTGSGCLLFLAGAWSRSAMECLQRGISVPKIISVMSEGMDICLDICTKSSISLEALSVEQSVSCSGASTCMQQQTTKAVSQTLKLSRHFYDAKCKNISTLLHPDITHIAEGLSHGCVDAMKLVITVSQIQSKNNKDNNCTTFDVNKVVTCLLPGLPEQDACALEGFIVLLSAEQASVAHHLQEQSLKVVLINGDLAHNYRHLGFNRPTGIRCVSDQSGLSSLSKEEEWMEKVASLLLKLEVTLILVSGLVSDKMILRCYNHCILVVEKVKASILKAFANATGAVPVTYATQLSKHCVGIGANVAMWREISSCGGKPSTTVNISTGANSGLITVILMSSVPGKLQTLEDQFWSCAYRLHHVLKDKVILRGAGVTEMLCVCHLQKRADVGNSVQNTETTTDPYRGVVLHLMADGLIDYMSTVIVNTGSFSKVRARTALSELLKGYNETLDIAAMFSQLFLEGEQEVNAVSAPVVSTDAPPLKIYDSLSVKQESFRKALDLVFLVLQADAEVITGVDQKTDDAQGSLMLL